MLSAHNDYTDWSGPTGFVNYCRPSEDLLKKRFAIIIQVWRAINQPIQSNPLAIADAKSVEPDDLLIAERRYPHRVGQTYRLKYSPRHRWFYFPQMRRDEALVFKVYDSEKDGCALHAAHCVRGSDHAAGRAAAPEHRSPRAGVFLGERRLRLLPARRTSSPGRRAAR